MVKASSSRGHWTAGKRRHADAGGWSRTRLSLTALLDHHYCSGVISARAVAAALMVSDRTVRRWISGEDRPPPDMQEAIAAWIAERRRRMSVPARGEKK